MKRETTLLLLADLVLIGLATMAAFVFRDSFDLLGDKWLGWATYTALTVGVSLCVFLLAGINRSVYRFANLNDYLWLSSLTVIVVLATLAIGFLINRLDGVARTLPILQVILIIGALILARVAYRLFHARRTASKIPHDELDEVENVLVVGVNPVADLFIRSVDDLANGRIRISGVLAPSEHNLRGRRIGTHPVLGLLGEVDAVRSQLKVHGVEISRIVVTVDEAELSELDLSRLTALEADQGIVIDFFANRLGLTQRRGAARSAAPGAAMSGSLDEGLAGGTAPQGLYRFGKRLVDVSLATCLLIVLWPLVVLVSLIVWIDVGRPLLFWQQRPGQAGRPMRVFKFRTMSVAHDDDGHRVADLHRLSAVGAMLRARRLDELPQLFNILVGDMSFVGPRPLLPIDQPQDRRDRLRAKPGLTGWAQVMGGRAITAADKASLDAWYIENMSFALDIEIMLRTIPMVLFGERIDARAIKKACDLTGRMPDYPPAREPAGAPAPVKVLEPPAPSRVDAL
jgi:lipopolysaccharide/colanic/teichoic acid biosynthesis glycosyltransferase